MARREKKKGKKFLKVGLFLLAAAAICAVAYFTGNPLLVRDILALFLIGGTGFTIGKSLANFVEKIKNRRDGSDSRSRSVVRNRDRGNELTMEEVYSMGPIDKTDTKTIDPGVGLKNVSETENKNNTKARKQ